MTNTLQTQIDTLQNYIDQLQTTEDSKEHFHLGFDIRKHMDTIYDNFDVSNITQHAITVQFKNETEKREIVYRGTVREMQEQITEILQHHKNNLNRPFFRFYVENQYGCKVV